FLEDVDVGVRGGLLLIHVFSLFVLDLLSLSEPTTELGTGSSSSPTVRFSGQMTAMKYTLPMPAVPNNEESGERWGARVEASRL
ncbi:hypothetical protein, partial [Halogeometricum borinquense]|uniref:hypothetical protein n=1 Tax=Halogeometricum borinquense TaxID=60847 RepID=UPI00344620A4